MRHALSVWQAGTGPHVVSHRDMKKIEAPYLLFALVFGFMALIAPYLMEEHRLTLEGRLAMLLFQAGMIFVCSLASAKHLHDKWVQEEINDRQARLRMPKPQEDSESTDATPRNDALLGPTSPAHEGVSDDQPMASGNDTLSSPVTSHDASTKPPVA